MHRKSLIILFIFLAFLCVSSLSLATNASNSIKNTTNGVIDGVVGFGEDVRNGVGYVENGIAGALDMDMNKDDNMNPASADTNNTKTAQSATSTMNGDYNAARVATAGTTSTNNIWVWIALAVAAIIIIGLVWYYTTQDNM